MSLVGRILDHTNRAQKETRSSHHPNQNFQIRSLHPLPTERVSKILLNIPAVVNSLKN